MAISKSMEMPPLAGGGGGVFFESQFRAKPQWPSKSIDLSGKVAIITGGGSGLGFHAGRLFLSHQLSHLIIGVRSLKNGEEAAGILRREYPGAQVSVWELEMGSYDSVTAFARRAEGELPRLDIAILNAGMFTPEFRLNPNTGHDQSIQINYLSTMLLVTLLLPVLKAKSAPGTPGRLTFVGSGSAYQAKFANRTKVPILASFDDLKVHPFSWAERYATSKLLGHPFLVKLVDYVDADDVIVNTVDPGFCKGTGLHRETSGITSALFSLGKSLSGRTLECGASTYMDAAVVKGKESHGSFIMDWVTKP